MPLLESLERRVRNRTRNSPIGPITPVMPRLADRLVSSYIDMQDQYTEKSRIGRGGYVHVSSLIGVCAREYVLAGQDEHSRPVKQITGGHRLLFSFGRTAEQHVRKQLTKSCGNVLFGQWKCKCGKMKHIGVKPKKTCPTCLGPVNIYGEHTLFDHEHRIVGNPDLAFLLNRHIVPIEIKSVNLSKEEWKEHSPDPDHVHQALMYRHLFHNECYTVHDDVIMLYVNRHFMWGSPYREYHVNGLKENHVRMVDDTLTLALEIKRGMEDKSFPPERMPQCSSPKSPRAKKCHMAARCFALRD